MDLWFVHPEAAQRHDLAELPGLLKRSDGFVWLDIPECDEAAAEVLKQVFEFHPLAVRDCRQRNQLAKTRVYPDHAFLILHAPEVGADGKIHFLELDQFIGTRYLVTVHGPTDPAVPEALVRREVLHVATRIESGRFRPATPFDLSYRITSAAASRQEAMVSALATEISGLEMRVMSDPGRQPEALLEELFTLRHRLLTVRTMAAQGREAYARMAKLNRLLPEGSGPLVEDLVDQFERVRGLCDGEEDFLHGALDIYQSRTETKMNYAMERLAVLAVVTLPITALASVYGMNVIVNNRTDFPHLTVVLIVMAVMSAALLRWAHRQGWW
jgi:Mg2+ and Co2+ transporter CorA